MVNTAGEALAEVFLGLVLVGVILLFSYCSHQTGYEKGLCAGKGGVRAEIGQEYQCIVKPVRVQ